MRTLFAVVGALTLMGCTTLTSEVTLPNNEKGYSINCGGLGISYCLNRAAELCPSGYALVGQQSSAGFVAPTAAVIMPIQQTQILARCT